MVLKIYNLLFNYCIRLILMIFINFNFSFCQENELSTTEKADAFINSLSTVRETDTSYLIVGVALILVIGCAGYFVIVPDMKRYSPGTHEIDYYLNRYDELINNLMESGSINEGQYLDLYNKLQAGFSLISEQNLTEELKCQRADILLHFLKSNFIPEILSGQKFDLELTTEVISRLVNI